MGGAHEALPELAVRRCGPQDRAAQADLFNRCFKKRVTAADLAWRYDRGPHGPALSFLTSLADGTGVAGYACSPRVVLARGEQASRAAVGETGDVMTDPAWRGRGLFRALDRACLQAAAERGWPCVFGLPNRRSAPIFLELGWRRVGTLRTWTFVLEHGPRARALRAREGRLAALGAGLGARRGRRARAGLCARAGPLRAEPLARFPAEVAALAQAVAPRFSWMVVRDAAYLDWRFLDAPSGLFRALGVTDARGLAGYAVVQLPRPGEPAGWLVDVLGRDDAAVGAAIEAGLSELERAGAACVQATAIDGSWWRAELARAGFLPPRPAHHLIAIAWLHRPEHPLSRAALDASAWYFTDGDRDDETMG